MQGYQRAFLDFAIHHGVLRFGAFTLKSGRHSPYFFNSGLFNTGRAIAELGRYYATAIIESGIEFDMLYGPAYKGIPLAVATAIGLNDQHQRSVPYVFNRKEVKSHGEGGRTVGAELSGRVLITDDVISAGTSVRESNRIIEQANAKVAGIVIALDRQERGGGTLSAIQEVAQSLGVKVISIACLDTLIHYLEEKPGMAAELESIRTYQMKYGVS